jgi:hypothetical protein
MSTHGFGVHLTFRDNGLTRTGKAAPTVANAITRRDVVTRSASPST